MSLLYRPSFILSVLICVPLLNKQIKSKPKKDIETTLTNMGITADDKGRPISSLTKADLIDLLEQQLASS